MPDATTSRRMAGAIRWTIGAAAAALVIGGGAYGWLGGPGGDSARSPPVAPASRPVPVTAGTAITKAFPIYRVGLGTVQAYNTVTIRVRVDGEVQKIAFREGQDVQQGDLLAQIDPRPYQALLEQARADKARDEALLANAKLDLDRYSTLVVKDFATHQSVDTQKALVAQYQAAIQHDQAAIDNAQVQLGYTTITSPLTGRTGIRLIDQGNIMHASDAGGLVVITQLKPIAVIFTLPQQYLPEIVDAIARRGPAPVEAYDQDNLVEPRRRTSRADRQPDRSGHRLGAAQSHIPERRRTALAGRVRQCAVAASTSAAGWSCPNRWCSRLPAAPMRLSLARAAPSRCGS